MNKLLSTFDSVRYALLPKKHYLKYQATRSSRRHEKELGMLQFLVRPGSGAVDGGAHKGVYSWYLSSICRQVHAFEPNPAMYDYLCKAVPGNVKTYRMALSDYSGSATFNVPCSGSKTHNTRGSLQDVTGQSGAHKLDIQVVDLDSLGLEDIGFIKLDVEGNEYAAIRGATELIRQSRPVILAELTGVGETRRNRSSACWKSGAICPLSRSTDACATLAPIPRPTYARTACFCRVRIRASMVAVGAVQQPVVVLVWPDPRMYHVMHCMETAPGPGQWCLFFPYGGLSVRLAIS